MSDPANQLCQRAQAGDTDAATELIAGFYQRIYAYLRRLCASDEDAADLTQKTFAKAWAALNTFAGKSSFSTWLHAIAHHVWLDWRRQHHPTEFQSDEWWAGCAAPTSTPLEDTSGRDLARQLYGLVDQLEDATRQTVHLHYYQGLSIAETAEVLGIATSTVKYRLRTALDFLRPRLTETRPLLQDPQR